MATPRIRTLNFLPEIFKTTTNTQFLKATLDQLVAQPNLEKIEGYLGSTFGYGTNARSNYVNEPTKVRTDYQLDPGVVFTKSSHTTQDFISYPGIIDALALEGAVTNNNSRLFSGQYYSWDSFTDLDKLINFNQYYWLPQGPDQVEVRTATVFSASSYVVTDTTTGYDVLADDAAVALTNPTITLLRGGIYTFAVNQASSFWIQGEPGVTGASALQSNLQTREVFGVDNNGASIGYVTFTVPEKSAQDAYNFPGNNMVDVVSSLPYDQVNGKLVSTLVGGIDGITSLNGRSLMFYNTGVVNEKGYISAFYDTTTFDQIDPVLADGFGNYEGGYYTDTSATFYRIVYEGESNAPVIRLIEDGQIPTNEKITASYGTQWISRSFYRNSTGTIMLIPYISALLDTLYYQDGSSPSKIGRLRLIDSNASNVLNVLTDIIGQKQYTSPTGVKFTNGLKVVFSGQVYPASYENVQYYVEGVGTAIELVPVNELIAPELFSVGSYIPYDTTSYDMENYDSSLYVPLIHDYITITRNAINKNAWTRSNRWFHIDVISATAEYNNDPESLTKYATFQNKARRPIIEFYPNLKMFDSGVVGKQPVDFIDFRTTDAFANVPGATSYHPDVEAYTGYDAVIEGAPGPLVTTATDTVIPTNVLTVGSTSGYRVNDRVTFSHTVKTAGTFVNGKTYTILSTGSTTFTLIGALTNLPGTVFTATGPGTGSGTAAENTFGGIEATTVSPQYTKTYYVKDIIDATHFTIAEFINGPIFVLDGTSGTMDVTVVPYSTTVTVPAGSTTGSFRVGHYIADSTNTLPRNTFITSITGTSELTITVSWNNEEIFAGTSVASLVSTVTTVDNFSVFDGSRVVFAADANPDVRNKIYVVRFSRMTSSPNTVLTLTLAPDGNVVDNNQTFVLRGHNYIGKTFHFADNEWHQGQQKTNVNQPPKFDIYDSTGISLSNTDSYTGTSFTGTTLFEYGIGTGTDDVILGFPLKYSSVNNTGDISFNVTLNEDTFDYVQGSSPVNKRVNTGYVYSHSSVTDYTRCLGWQTAVSPSVQYQIFEFNYSAAAPTRTFTCDVSMKTIAGEIAPSILVYDNNVIQHRGMYSFVVEPYSTTVTFDMPADSGDSVVQILLLSDQVSKTAYYGIPNNLSNNPLNDELTTVNVGDLRRHYHSVFCNSPDTMGTTFGPNNVRDLGNLVPYGNTIVQHSASLVAPAAFLRKQNNSLFNALLFNSREYVNYKTLLVSTVDATEYSVYQTPAYMLDTALNQISLSKTTGNSFFWSDMLPSKAPYINNVYTFANTMSVSIYPLSATYDFARANYSGVLVYLTREVSGLSRTTQLIRGVDYSIDDISPSLTVTTDLIPGDVINISEYNQTYGSYVPNTPTKLGLYPSTIPKIIQDASYSQPTYFIVGHDGSYNRLYGEYDPVTGRLIDFRDQVLLEFEKRIYNNLKISSALPISKTDIIPGFFRETEYSHDEIIAVYSSAFLNWVGQNRIDYKRQLFNTGNEFSYNYYQTNNKIDDRRIDQGHWRGVYEYFYDTSNPDTAPWEMLGFTDMPTWWETRYGAAPYTSDNSVLWSDLEAGISWNNGSPIVVPGSVRTGLSRIIPVDSAGNLVSPFVAVVGNYTGTGFIRDWKVGDLGPAEMSYRRSSSWPFDLMRIMALTKPAEFFNLAIDVDDYRYNEEFNQYLVNDRSHLVVSNVELYGSGTPKTSYINWIVDYVKQSGVDATVSIIDVLSELDVRLVYRLAGFSDKNLLKFYVEKGTPNSKSSSLLIPDESYSVLLYDNQPFTKLVYSSAIVQLTTSGYKVYGNSQTNAYFTTVQPRINGNYDKIIIDNLSVQIANDYSDTTVVVPYGTEFSTVQEVSQFLSNYGRYLTQQGAVFDKIENGVAVTWRQMVAEFLYWAQTGWETGSLLNVNPAAELLTLNKDSCIVQPLTMHQQNFILNQNMYPIQTSDLAIVRDGTLFSATPLKLGDTINYSEFTISNFEHGVVFDNVTLFDDMIYDLVTGLRQNRIIVRGTKTASWDGTIDAQGFILNQDNVTEWDKETKYATGSIVKYKNKYWVSPTAVQSSDTFDETLWKKTEYNEIQIGLLPNPSTRSYESTVHYDTNRANLEKDGDLLGFSLIGYRPRDYLASADLSDITQVNVYKNLIKNKGTKNASDVFKGAELAQGGIDYNIYENWAIKTSEFGGVLNSNFVEMRLDADKLTGNPSMVELTSGLWTTGVHQEVPVSSLYNYNRAVFDPKVLPILDGLSPNAILPDAGYVNFEDVKMSSYFYSGLSSAVNATGTAVPLNKLYVRDSIWLANYRGTWQVYTPAPIGQVISARNAHDNIISITFATRHGLTKHQPFAIVNFNAEIDGYYIVRAVTDPYTVEITVSRTIIFSVISGLGIGFAFQSQRVATPADITTLPLLNTEFTRNRVWVDTDQTSNWAVYDKSINYKFKLDFTRPAKYAPEVPRSPSVTYGSAVAYSPDMGYLISDPSKGEAYRYTHDLSSDTYLERQILTGAASFGAAIEHVDDIYVVSQPTTTPSVFIYKLNDTAMLDDFSLEQTIVAPVGVTDWGSAVALSGDKNWIYISDTVNNTVHVYRKSAITGTYEASSTIDGDALALTTAGDNFGHSIATDHYGDILVVGAPNKNLGSVNDWGYSYVFNRVEQNIEAQYTSFPLVPVIVSLAIDTAPYKIELLATATSVTTNLITVGDTTGMVTGMPLTFSGTILPGSGLAADRVYYVHSVVDSTTFKITAERAGTATVLFNSTGSTTVTVQSRPLFISINGTAVTDSEYAIISDTLRIFGSVNAGDIINVGSSSFVLAQTLTTGSTSRIGVQFGTCVDTNTYASEILVGAPFELNTEQQNNQNQEGGVYRYTNAGGKYGFLHGTTPCVISAPAKVLLNGYLVNLPAGDATTTATAINYAGITNVRATATDGKLSVYLINVELTTPNDKLTLSVIDPLVFNMLGIPMYTQTQFITSPHVGDRTQFGTAVKFNEFGSFVVSAPVATRHAAMVIDCPDVMATSDTDTVFDNNTTRWVDSAKNAGAAYMFDYLSVNNESLQTPGMFVYAQCVNDTRLEYGSQPRYGSAIDFNHGVVIIGTPGLHPGVINGGAITFNNYDALGNQNWAVRRSSAPIVDSARIQNIQLYSATTNTTLDNLDYIDPLQGKLLGSVRQNIDTISNSDPAGYNSEETTTRGAMLWSSHQVGHLWFDTSNTRFINYHQNDITYNSKHWGKVFPGSDVAVYSWVSSSVPPIDYTGPGVPKDSSDYSVEYGISSTGATVPTYFFWARKTNIVFTGIGKTLSDVIIESYIAAPAASGISFFSPIAANIFALYNCEGSINDTDTVLHVGYSTGANSDESHSLYSLIRTDFADDFLPGAPLKGSTTLPESLYSRMLSGLSGCDLSGEIVPNPYLPKPVQYGISARPNQSFFVDRLTALKNYLTYANEVLALYPVAETKQPTYLFKEGELNPSSPAGQLFFNTTNYWNYVSWWATGHDSSTKASVQVGKYADLATLTASPNMIVTVLANGDGKTETYMYDAGSGWERIGLQAGTIEFSSALWDYSTARTGFGDNFFDTAPYSEFPSEETRNIIRALTEEIYTGELLIHRNKSLVLLFEFIQSETLDMNNYLPWLNKTSFVDVSHTIRELLPLPVFQIDKQEFLEGYLNEVKPYHVTIKEFLFKYTGTDSYAGMVSDFDVPATYNAAEERYVTPAMVYRSPGVNEYLPTAPIWQTAPYQSWFKNYGLGLTGVNAFPITVLTSYITLNEPEFSVDNAFGLPINGTVLIDDEMIGYSTVDRARSVVGGLTRGILGTDVTTHLPGAQIIIDLPAVLVLDGGRGYIEPPKVTAYIDTSIYPAPTRPAILEAVMQLDSIMRIDVKDPGQGYAVLPEIVISPAIIAPFTGAQVSLSTNSILLSSPMIQTGDLVKYEVGTVTAPVGGLVPGQYYYAGVLDIVPSFIIALYTNYADSLVDHDRISFSTTGTGPNHSLIVSARASCVTTAAPVRENQLTLRFDRTTYQSKMTDWVSGAFYGSFFAGLLNSSMHVASSSVTLQNSRPPISSITVSAAGGVFELDSVTSRETLTWSSRTRNVVQTVAANNAIRIMPSLGGSAYEGEVGPTTGFFVGMPIKFIGPVIGGLLSEVTYYVESVVNDVDFTIMDDSSIQVPVSNAIVGSAPLLAYTGTIDSIAIVSLNYPGMLEVTHTDAVTNEITVPLTMSGQLGTTDFYVGLPIFFTGAVFGAVVENDQYYVTTIIDKQTFTMSKVPDPIMIQVTETRVSDPASGRNFVVICESTVGLSVDDPVIFTDMFVSGVTATTFGGLLFGTTYYVNVLDQDGITMIVSETPYGGNIFEVSDQIGTCTATNQIETATLTTSTGSMTLNVGLPLSPGQITGQKFTFYPTSNQYSGITGTVSGQVTRTLYSALPSPYNYLSIGNSPGGLDNFYLGMPIKVSSNYGNLVAGTTYYVIAKDTVVTTVIESFATNQFECTSTIGFYADMPIKFSVQEFGGIVLGNEYYVKAVVDSTHFTITATPGGAVFVLTTQEGTMTVTGAPFIVVSDVLGGTAFDPGTVTTTTTLTQTPTVTPVFGVSFMLGGYGIITTNPGKGYAIGNKITILGSTIGGASPTNNLTLTVDTTGLIVSATTTSSTGNKITCASTFGFAVNEPVVFTGMTVAGISVTNFGNLISGTTYFVNTVVSETEFSVSATIGGVVFSLTDVTIGSMTVTNHNGAIATVTANGIPNQTAHQYYLKVISATDCEVYSDPIMTIPVSATDFTYVGIVNTGVSETATGTNLITVGDTTSFAVNDPVVFTGAVFGNLVLGQTYYVLSIPNGTTLTVSETVAGSTFALTNATGSCTMAKLGDYILLPNPFYFDQSLVRFNHKVYQCLISNNDPEFIFGKWQLLRSDDRRLNALDRIYGYYQPTVNMPGLDPAQLVAGITYPNGTYLGNAFAPADELVVDTVLQDQAFYPVDIDTAAILWDGAAYIAVSNGPTYSATITSADTALWSIDELSTHVIQVTDILYAASMYVITARNRATPLLVSTDGVTWTTNGAYTIVGALGPDTTSLSAGALSLNSIAYANGTFVAVGENIVTSRDSYLWSETYAFADNGLVKTLNSVAAVNTLGFAGFVAVGSGEHLSNPLDPWSVVNINLLMTSLDGRSWSTPSSALTSDALYAVASSDALIVLAGDNGSRFVSNNGSNWTNVTSGTANIRSLIYANSMFVAVGTQGSIETSTDGVTWSTQVSGTTKNLTDITWNSNTSLYVVAGSNNTLLQSSDGVIWTNSMVFAPAETTYTVQGDPFTSGYGPEELVPGVVSDNLTMIIATRPGTNWPITTYGHAGYNSVSVEISPMPGQLVFSFEHVVAIPAQISVYQLGVDGLGTRLVEGTLYTVNWPEYTVALPTEMSAGTKLRIDVYEVGNGDQLVKSNTENEPIRANIVTGFNEIYLQCNYSATTFAGSGVIRPDSESVIAIATETISTDNTILCVSVYEFVLNQSIAFHGDVIGGVTSHVGLSSSVTATTAVTNIITCDSTASFTIGQQAIFTGESFGGIVATTVYYILTVDSINTFTVSDTPGGIPVVLTTATGMLMVSVGKVYFVKSISPSTNRITISETRLAGIAGPVFALTDDLGAMEVVIRMGLGLVWTPPLMRHNGVALVMGSMNTVSETKASVNTIKVESTLGIYANEQITFSNTMFGGILPHAVYYVKTVVNDNEFTVSDTLGGAVVTLTDATGGAVSVNGDYAFGIDPTGLNAKIVFAAQYNHVDDYMAFSVFGETFPDQYGYTLPEIETFVAVGATSTFALTNFVGEDNPMSAVVEKNGLRLTDTAYSIDPNTNILTMTPAVADADVVTVTSFNLTEQQYLHTQYGLTGKTVANIVFVDNAITTPLAITDVTATTVTTNVITCDSTAGFVLNQTIIFMSSGPGSFGGITFGTVYFVKTIDVDTVSFTISATQGGPTFVLSNWTGLVIARVGGKPAVRVTTGIPHTFLADEIIRIDGTLGSTQLNNNTFYVRPVSETQFDLYTVPYDPSLAFTNSPVTEITGWLGGGYAWLDRTYTLTCSIASATTNSNSTITCSSSTMLVPGTPVQFTGVAFGGLDSDVNSGAFVVGHAYIILTLGTTDFTLIGARENTPGVQFVASDVGVGSGVARAVYFVRDIPDTTHFTVSHEYTIGTLLPLTNAVGTMLVTQWDQIDEDRLWVTVNGYRVPSSSLHINPGNNLSILTTIDAGDEVIITNMIPTATPNELVYMQHVNKDQVGSAYRANSHTRTWLADDLFITDDVIAVHDLATITRTIVHSVVAPAADDGVINVGLPADKRLICNVTVFNETTSTTVNSALYRVVIVDLAPILKITGQVTAGDSLVITIVEGNLVYIAGEQIRFTTADPSTNTLSGLRRGMNGTGVLTNIPRYSEVYGILSQQKLSDVLYPNSWAEKDYIDIAGIRPLQLSNTLAAQFLRQDVS